MKTLARKSSLKLVLKIISYSVINIFLAFLYGYLTIDILANTNSRTGAMILSILIPLYIIEKTANFTGMERLVKFGSGLILYAVAGILLHGVNILVTTTFLPAVLLTLLLLYFWE